jgi:peptide/nickel transport system ATP-binding protein
LWKPGYFPVLRKVQELTKGFTFGKMSAQPQQNVLEVRDLEIRFKGRQEFYAIRKISFSLQKGATLALVGQSGSGKSLTSLALMGLLPKSADSSGQIHLQKSDDSFVDLNALQAHEWTAIRGKYIGMIFQEPMSALNPLQTCAQQLMESILVHQRLSKKEAYQLAVDWFKKVKMPDPERLLQRYPHQLSGGQKQRLMIAMAMCNHPAVLIADEPTTALDVTLQKDIILLMKELQQEFQTAILFITHDLALARTLTSRFLVLEKGAIATQDVLFRQEEKLRLPTTPAALEMPLLQVDQLSVRFEQGINWLGKSTGHFTAVDNVSFELYKGETLGLVGESGCGKSTLSKCILGLQQPGSGSIYYKGQDITRYSSREWRKLRRYIQIIFQDPYSSLNQRMRIGDALAEPLIVHKICAPKDIHRKVGQLLDMVGLPAASGNKYPHEFSGGQRQRISIARALAVNPELIICDESVSALDVKIQAQILDLLSSLQQEFQLTYLFITHDLHVVKRISDRVMVMERGKIVEQGPTEQIMYHPAEAYTRKLLQAVPE